MKRRLFNIFAVVSIAICLVSLITLRVFPNGLHAVVYRDSFGWGHYGGIAIKGIGLYEVHGYAKPMIYLSLPGWVLAGLAVVSALLPSFMAFRGRNRRINDSLASGLCPTCGYDLRATPERCPECGSVPSGDKQTAILN